MPIPTDTFWNIKRLNIVFALSSVALVGTMLWSVVQDFDRNWRQYQRDAKVWDAALTRDEIDLKERRLKRGEIATLDAQIAAQDRAIAQKQAEIDQLDAQTKQIQSDLDVLSATYKTLKAETQVQEAAYQAARTGGQTEEARRIQDQIRQPQAQLALWEEQMFQSKEQIKENKKKQAEITKDRDAKVKERDAHFEQIALLKKKQQQLEPGFLGQISQHVRAMPLLQFLNPTESVKQVLVPDVLTDMGGFKKVESIDRCITCHVNIADKRFSEPVVMTFLERQVAGVRGVQFPDAAKEASDPKATPIDPGPAAMPEFWHAWATKLLPPVALTPLDEQLNRVIDVAGPFAQPPVSQELRAKVTAAMAAPAAFAESDRAARDKAALDLIRQIYTQHDAMADAVMRSEGQDPAKLSDAARPAARQAAAAKIKPARDAAFNYPALARQAVLRHLSAHAHDPTPPQRLLEDRYRRALIADLNAARAKAGQEALDDSRAMLAHPRLDLYVDRDSRHPMEGNATEGKIGVGCASCHDGSGMETNFVLAAHVAREIWVDNKTGAPVLAEQITKDKNGHSGHEGHDAPTMDSMLRAVYPADAIAPTEAGDLHLNLDKHANGHGHNGNAHGGHVPAHVDVAVDYVDPVTGQSGKAVPQAQHWSAKYEAESGTSFKDVYHYWDTPMRRTELMQANCARCHNNVADIADEAPILNEGRTLFAEMGCVNCHQMDSITEKERRRVGPDLTHVAQKLSPEFVNTWVFAPKSFRPTTRMPHFFLLENNSSDEEIRRSRQEARAITEYLMVTSRVLPQKHALPTTKPAAVASSGPVKDPHCVDATCESCESPATGPAATAPSTRPAAAPTTNPAAAAPASPLVADAENGRKLFRAIGCMACHTNLHLPATALDNPTTEIPGLTVAEQWITQDLIKKGELAARLRAEVQQEVTQRLESGLAAKVEAELVGSIEQNLRKPLEDRIDEELLTEAAKPKKPSELSARERLTLRRQISAEAKKRVDAEWEKISKTELPAKLAEAKAKLPAAIAAARRELPTAIAAEVQAKLAERVAAEARRQFDAMSYNERQLYVAENFDPPARLTESNHPTWPDGTKKPLFIRHGPELSGIGTKLLDHRSPEQARQWLYQWLKEPKHYNSYTAMPSLRLSDQEALDLTEHLLQQKRDGATAPPTYVDGNREGQKVADAWAAGLPAVDTAKLIELTAFFLRSQFSTQTAIAKADERAQLIRMVSAELEVNKESDLGSGKRAEDWANQLADTASSRGLSGNDQLRLVYLGKKLIGHYGCMNCHNLHAAETLTSPCANLSDWGQKGVDKLDYAFLDHHKVAEGPPAAVIPMVNGLAGEAAKLAHIKLEGNGGSGGERSSLSKPVSVGWPHVDHRRESWLQQKLLNSRIYDRGKVLLEPQPGKVGAKGVLEEPGKPYDKLKMPTFYLNEHQVHAITTFVLSNRDKLVSDRLVTRSNPAESQQVAYGRWLTEQYNCISCHQTEKNKPLVHQFYVAADIAAKAPPTLHGEGSRVHPDWLHTFLNHVEPIRPTMQPAGGIRMPSFNFQDQRGEVEALIAYFVAASNKEHRDLRRHLEPVVKWHNAATEREAKKLHEEQKKKDEEAKKQAKAVAANGGAAPATSPAMREAIASSTQPATNPTIASTTQPASVPPPSPGFAVASAIEEHRVLRIELPKLPAPRPPRDRVPADEWFREDDLGASTQWLRQWAIDTGQLKEFQFDPFRNSDAELKANYAQLLFRARYLANLYNAPERFTDRSPPVAGPERLTRGFMLFQLMNCQQCHTLTPRGPADFAAPPANVTAPNLTMVNARIQRRWARHWVQDTNVLIPGTPMPPFFTGLPQNIPAGGYPLGGHAWVDAVTTPFDKQKQAFNAYFGKTADEQAALLLDYVYHMSATGQTVPAALQPGQMPQGLPEFAQDPEPPPPPVAATQPATPEVVTPQPAPPMPEGVNVSGFVKFQGTPPPRQPIAGVANVAACAAHHATPPLDDSLVVSKQGELANVVVSISSGLPKRPWPVPGDPVVLDQKGCIYHPHVVALMIGQPLLAKNSDAFAHNVHTIPSLNSEQNMQMPTVHPGAPLQPLKAAETFKVKCDVHPWMGAWIAAFDHPFFAVTGEDGYFTIKNLPPGKYTLTAWHERLGKQEQPITIEAGKTAPEIEFNFK